MTSLKYTYLKGLREGPVLTLLSAIHVLRVFVIFSKFYMINLFDLGYEHFFRNDWGMTYFGQALTHSIAQYACDEPLSGIMGRVCP